MAASTTSLSEANGVIDSELAALEQRLNLLIAHAKVLRATNDNLKRDLAAAEARNEVLSERVAEAKRRLDALVARLPE
jgi:cell division protein ZapB